MKILILLSFFISTSLLAATNCTELPSKDSCDFYQDCMESEYACETTGHSYLTDYGDKYCRLFETNKSKFTSKGRVWIKNVKICLQQQLFRKYIQPGIDYSVPKVQKCWGISKFAFRSHHNCYVRPKGTMSSGLCPLWRDYRNVLSVVKPFRNFRGKYGKETRDQVRKTMATCTKYWGKRSIGLKAGQSLEALDALNEIESILNEIE